MDLDHGDGDGLLLDYERRGVARSEDQSEDNLHLPCFAATRQPVTCAGCTPKTPSQMYSGRRQRKCKSKWAALLRYSLPGRGRGCDMVHWMEGHGGTWRDMEGARAR